MPPIVHVTFVRMKVTFVKLVATTFTVPVSEPPGVLQMKFLPLWRAMSL